MILRELVAFESQGADAFFGEPEFASADLLTAAPDGRGVISLIELPQLADRPAVFSTFLMWLLADLFHDLPEVGDVEKPKLVFFLDEAHLLFDDASDAFLDQVARTVRLIRSKGVGVFFVTQQPTDVPEEVLAQLGSRVQHALRAHTPKEGKALKQTVETYPTSGYDDLGAVLTTLGIGEAVVTVMDERGAPTPVAWTRLRAPESLMAPAEPAAMQAAVQASPRMATYGTAVDRESAHEILAARLEEGARKQAEEQAQEQAQGQAREQEQAARGPAPLPEDDLDRALRQEAEAAARRGRGSGGSGRSRPAPARERDVVGEVMGSPVVKDLVRTAAREIARGLFRTGRR